MRTKIPPSLKKRNKKHKENGENSCQIARKKKNKQKYYKECRNLVQNREIKKIVYVYICERVLSSN